MVGRQSYPFVVLNANVLFLLVMKDVPVWFFFTSKRIEKSFKTITEAENQMKMLGEMAANCNN